MPVPPGDGLPHPHLLKTIVFARAQTLEALQVHNGIEYGDMQLISEAYDILKTVGGMSNPELVDAFNEWNKVRHCTLRP